MEGKHGSTGPFRAFLSHRYKSPTVNSYFFGLFENEAEIQFEVDIGTVATNVTRLERLIRYADAFIGIYPYPAEEPVHLSRPDLLKASRYFRLELDLAVRAKKPALLFIDERYGNILDTPPSILRSRFDHRDILSAGGSAHEPRFRSQIRLFRDTVTASMQYNTSRLSIERRSPNVGLLLPPASDTEEVYSHDHFHLVESQIQEVASVDSVRLPWPPVLEGRFYSLIDDIDWLIVDLGDRMSRTGIVPFLHGQFIPMVRLMHTKPAPTNDRLSQLESTLFGAYEVGYIKDIATWSDKDTLASELYKRVSTIYTPRRLIANSTEAQNYFHSAALRKEAVFVSYSRKDAEIADEILSSLKKRFQQVFDYRDEGESIKPGQSWVEQIFNSLYTSAIGIMLLSDSYFSSGNCRHEAEEMVALRDSNKIQVFPIKVRQGKMDMPSWLGNIQYDKLWTPSKSDELVERIIKSRENSL
jgi:hypothetical protein